MSCSCAVCFLSTVGLVVGAVLLTLAPRVDSTLTSMCRAVLEKIIVYCRDFFWSHLFALCKSECRMEKLKEWVSQGKQKPRCDVYFLKGG